jgi:hypothetical protein
MAYEQPPSPEFSGQEQELIGRLREKGPEDPEARASLMRWYDAAAAEARKPEGNRSRAEIEVQIRLAGIYRAAGGYDSARETLDAVRFGALNDPSAGDLYGQAMAMMDEIDVERGLS